MAVYYVDTSVWRDHLESREDHLRPLGELAFQFLKQAMERRDTILYSELVLEELKLKYTSDEIERYCFEFLRDMRLIKEVKISRKQVDEAGKIAGERKVPRGDALHAVLARDNNATVVTRDRHFDSLQDIAKPLKPEEVT